MKKIYENLMKAYYTKGKIGNARPYDVNHAKRVAYMVAKRIYENKVA